jgi:hypothetical protein
MINETILTGLHNPDCAFYVGTFFGQIFVVKWLIFLLIAFAIVKAIDRLALEPILQWIKKKTWKK